MHENYVYMTVSTQKEHHVKVFNPTTSLLTATMIV